METPAGPLWLAGRRGEEVRMHRLRHVLQRQRLISAAPDASVREAAEAMVRARTGAILILHGRTLVGIFTERDLMTRVVVPGRDPDTTRVGDVMTDQVATAGVGDSVNHCMDEMKRLGCRHLPVVEDGEVIGMVSMRDLLRDELVEQGEEIRSLKAYLHQQPL
jgi:signal-transduction protein with cAMP-binding, CBS, and nucleotidyltransferase domain